MNWRRALIRILPYFITICGCAVVAGLTHTTISSQRMESDGRFLHLGPFCLSSNHSFHAHLFYVVSLASTIGFGVLAPCSSLMKLYSVFISMLGLPLFVFIMADSGKRLADLCQLLQYKYFGPSGCCGGGDPVIQASIHRIERRTANISLGTIGLGSLAIDYEDDASMDGLPGYHHQELNPWIGIVLFVFCFHLLVAYYVYVEEYWPSDGYYYTLMIFLAGDVSFRRFKYTVPVYVIIIIGFALMSMIINIALRNIDNFAKRVQLNVEAQIQSYQELGEDMPSADSLLSKALSESKGCCLTSWCISETKMTELKMQAVKERNYANVLTETIKKLPPSGDDAKSDKACQVVIPAVENKSTESLWKSMDSIDQALQVNPTLSHSQSQVDYQLVTALTQTSAAEDLESKHCQTTLPRQTNADKTAQTDSQRTPTPLPRSRPSGPHTVVYEYSYSKGRSPSNFKRY